MVGDHEPMPRCVCECVISGAPDNALLNLLQRQLDRCGPEHLVGSRPGPVGCPVGYFAVMAVCASWLLAAALCVVAVRYGLGRRHRPRVVRRTEDLLAPMSGGVSVGRTPPARQIGRRTMGGSGWSERVVNLAKAGRTQAAGRRRRPEAEERGRLGVVGPRVGGPWDDGGAGEVEGTSPAG